MNTQESDIMQTLFLQPFINQRILAELSGHSLGVVNRSISNLIAKGYLDENIQPTLKAREEYKEKAPKNAVILAAGFGMRMIPINLEMPKGLLEVNGKPLVERLIKQLHEVGITEIYVVVGFMKECYEYLIDEYGVELVVNREYASKNNLHSLKLVLDKLSNTFIVPCDIWCDKNLFRQHGMYSWYMVSSLVDDDSEVRVNRKMELAAVSKSESGNAMIGITYLLGEDSQFVKRRVEELCRDNAYDDAFWETALYQKGKMIVAAKVVSASDAVEVNTYEQLRELDGESNHLKSEALDTIAEALHVSVNEIVDIMVLKKGMTNRSFFFMQGN